MSELTYTIKRHASARRVIISVRVSGEVIVTLPRRASPERAEDFVKAKLSWILATQEKMKRKYEGKVPLKQTRTEYLQKKSQALKFIKERIEYFNAHYHFTFGRISIRMQKSRWGSCSGKGNLNFNYKLIDLPQEMADYIIVHELCHLAHMNHGPHFWAAVAETIPNHKEIRRALRANYIHVS